MQCKDVIPKINLNNIYIYIYIIDIIGFYYNAIETPYLVRTFLIRDFTNCKILNVIVDKKTASVTIHQKKVQLQNVTEATKRRQNAADRFSSRRRWHFTTTMPVPTPHDRYHMPPVFSARVHVLQPWLACCTHSD